MAGIQGLTDTGFSISGKAQETISGGQLVKPVSGATVLGTTGNLTSSVEWGLADAVGDIDKVVGVAQNTGVSGDTISVSLTGVHGLYAANAIVAGAALAGDSSVATADAVTSILAANASGAMVYFGRALSTAASGQLVAVNLR